MERVVNYPRPPALVASPAHVVVEALGRRLADSHRSLLVLETFHPPTVYLPPEALQLELLEAVPGRSYCEWKGLATYVDVVLGERRLRRAGWTYTDPTPAFRPLAGWFSFYPALMDACSIDGERVTPQPGGFYGGWITSRVCGPFKGDPLHPELI